MDLERNYCYYWCDEWWVRLIYWGLFMLGKLNGRNLVYLIWYCWIKGWVLVELVEKVNFIFDCFFF